MQAKSVKSQRFHEALGSVAFFLKTYLPIANAHMTDFIVKDWWHKMIPEAIREDLLRLNDDDLALLPSGKLYPLQECSESEDTLTSPEPDSSLMVCGEPSDVRTGQKPMWEESVMPSWHHGTLREFVVACQQRSLVNMKIILTNVDDLTQQIDSSEEMPVEFMSLKKQHEVHALTKICADVAQKHNINIVVDIGSGKGYLSSQLTLQHGFRVLGIDASHINTEGATSRVQKLGRQWTGLVTRVRKNRPATEYQTAGCDTTGCGTAVPPVTSVKCELALDSPSMESSGHTAGANHHGVTHGRFVAITHSVNKSTDIQNLLKEHLTVSDQYKCAMTSACDKKSPPGYNTRCDGSNSLNHATQCPRDLTDTACHPRKKDDLNLEKVTMKCEGGNQGGSEPEYDPLPYMLVALHACGDLTPNTLQLFADKPEARILCNVGCCYHHLSEQFIRCPFDRSDSEESDGFPMSQFLIRRQCQLGRNARMLASQAPDRMADSGKTPSHSLYWRALLQVILRDVTGEVRNDWKVGRLAGKCTHFKQYVEKALNKLGFPDQSLGIDTDRYEQVYGTYLKYIRCFVQLKSALAPCIEAVILLDRACYLLEQVDVSEVHLIQAFDPVVSPRCHALVAAKSPR